MKISTCIEELEKLQGKYGNLDVLVYMDGYPCGINLIQYKVAEKNQFPKEYNMPKGFEFVSII